MHIESLSFAQAGLLVLAILAVSFMLWVLYHFHLESKRLKARRKHTPGLVHTAWSRVHRTSTKWFGVGVGISVLTVAAVAQSAPQTTATAGVASAVTPQAPQPAPAVPLAIPATAGPLSTAAPTTIDAGPFGELEVTGILSGFGYAQSNASPGDRAARGDVSNGQVFVQKTSGVVQYFLQAGAYNIPALGTPGISTRNTISDYFGPLPQAYLKLTPKGNFSLLIGKLPTLIGAEYTFTFENLNIGRGLLWNQENAVNRGLQVNYGKGKLSSSVSWNDGFYSNRYNWLTGTATYAFSSANSLQLVAGGNLGHTSYSTLATPLYQNNSAIYNIIYTHTAKKWMIEPYVQYTRVPASTRVGVARTSATLGGALLGTYTFTPHISLPSRVEYIGSTGNLQNGSVNLLYGPGSGAWSVTVTPTYQDKAFFARGEFSVIHATSYTPGDAFGRTGSSSAQVRGQIETGFMF